MHTDVYVYINLLIEVNTTMHPTTLEHISGHTFYYSFTHPEAFEL